MAEATIKIDGINVNITSDIFSVKFMDLVKAIEHFQEKYKQPHNRFINPSQSRIMMDLSKKSFISFTDASVHNFERIGDDKIKQISQIIDRIEEPKDEVFYLTDNELILQIEKYLKICNHTGIENYYKDIRLKYRPFNLSGLYSKKYGIKTDKQRKIIRDMLRRCIQFTKSEYFKNKLKQNGN